MGHLSGMAMAAGVVIPRLDRYALLCDMTETNVPDPLHHGS
jgi:hypothetical protein